MPKTEDFKTSKAVQNSLFKGAAFHRNEAQTAAQPTARPAAQSQARAAASNGFDDRSDKEKLAKALIAQSWDGKTDPINFAISARKTYGPDLVDEVYFSKAAEEYKKAGNGVPWWSAARHFNLELFRGGNAGQMFKPNTDMLNSVAWGTGDVKQY